MSTKTVKRTRTYFNKTRNEWVTRVYDYELIKVDGKYTTKGSKKTAGRLLIVGKNGIYKDRLDALLETAEDPAVRSDIMSKVKEAERKGKRLSTRSLLSKVAESKIEKFFINAGYTEEDIMEEYGLTREVLFDPANWEGSVFSYGGLKYRLRFQARYTGSVLEVIA